MHEIVTLQFGQQANYLATHFWNTQESYFTYTGEDESPVNHDILFRQGVGADGSDTFTPRTLIYDLKGAFGSLRRTNALYALQEDLEPKANNIWPGQTIVQRATAVAESTYQAHLNQGLEPPPLTTEDVNYWSDYNRVFYHPRSIVQLSEYEQNAQLMPFETWELGEELFHSLDGEHDLLDRDTRPFIEECDQLQGLQIITCADDAWGGFAARYLDRLRDEFGKKSIWVWALEDNTSVKPRDKRLLQLLNTARSVHSLSQQASMYIPVSTNPYSPSYVRLDHRDQWHTSALQATAFESFTLQSRLRSLETMGGGMNELEAKINYNGKRNIGRLQFSLTKEHCNDHSSESHDNIDIFPQNKHGYHVGVASERTFSGVGMTRGRKYDEPEEMDMDNDHWTAYRSDLKFPILDSFPDIYDLGPGRPRSAQVHTSISTSSCIAERLLFLRKVTRRLAPYDEEEELSSRLLSIGIEYEHWRVDSSEDDD